MIIMKRQTPINVPKTAESFSIDFWVDTTSSSSGSGGNFSGFKMAARKQRYTVIFNDITLTICVC
jgi:hypothetical protein